MHTRSSFRQFGGRFFILGLVIGLLVWLPLEDQSILMPVLLALPVAGSVGRLFSQRFHWNYILGGAITGLVVAPTTLLWMAFKTGVHGHGTPDYTAFQIVTVIYSTPAWLLAGCLFGWGRQKLHLRSTSAARSSNK